MALIYQPLQKLTPAGSPSGVWHMCVFSDEESWLPNPIGYCADNCPGHDTSDGAFQHYRDFVADTAWVDDNPDVQRRCVVCKAFTTLIMRARSGHHEAVLCATHAIPRVFRELL